MGEHEQENPQSHNEPAKKRKSLKVALRDGSAFTVMDYFGTAYFEAFVVALGFAAQQVAYILTIPQFITSLSQLASQRLIRRFGRFRVLTDAVFFQAITIILLVFLGIWTQSIILIILFLSLFYALGAIGGNAWVSVMGDLVPERIRGRYFSIRARIMGITAAISLVIAGLLVQFLSDQYGVYAFISIFSIAALARFYSFTLLRQYYDPPHEELSREEEFSFFRFITPVAKSNFARYAHFHAAFMFSVFLVAPLMAFYKLDVLGFNYIEFTAIKGGFLLGSIVSLRYWGSITDQYGNRINFLFTGVLIGLYVLAYSFIISFWGLFFLEIIGGIVWSGFSLSTANYIFDAVSRKKRAIVNGYLTIMRGTAVLAGGLGAVVLLEVLIAYDGVVVAGHETIYQTVLFISGIARMGIALVFWRFIKEVRPVEHRSLRTMMYTPFSGFRTTTNYLLGVAMSPMHYAIRRLDEYEEKSLNSVLKSEFDDEKR